MSSDGSMTGDSGMVRVMGMVVVSLLGIAVSIGLVANIIGTNAEEDPNDPLIRNALVQRLEPIGKVRTSADELEVADAAAGGDAPGLVVASADAGAVKTGKELVEVGACAGCHAAGVAGAPLLGDADAWGERREKGYETLVTHVIEGYNAMPARGGSTYTDDEIRTAVQYIAMFPEDEPAADAAAAPAPAPAPAEGQDGEQVAQADTGADPAANADVEIPETRAEADAIPAEKAVTDPSVKPSGDAAADAKDAESGSDQDATATDGATSSSTVEGAPDVGDQENDMQADDSSAMAGGDTNDMNADDASKGTVTTRQTPAEPAADEAAADEALLNQVSGDVAVADDAQIAVGMPVPEGMSDDVKAAVDGVCAGCHIAGVANAPKIGDAAAWQERVDKGLATLTSSVVNGIGVMPAMGGSGLAEEDVPTAIQYMLSKTQP